jgi:hypothetical protein
MSRNAVSKIPSSPTKGLRPKSPPKPVEAPVQPPVPTKSYEELERERAERVAKLKKANELDNRLIIIVMIMWAVIPGLTLLGMLLKFLNVL